MGQQVFKEYLSIVDGSKIDFDPSTVLSDRGKDDVRIFCSSKISDSQIDYIRQVREHVSRLTHSHQWKQMDTLITGLLTGTAYPWAAQYYRGIVDKMIGSVMRKQVLRDTLAKKIQDDAQGDSSIFAPAVAAGNEQQRAQQLSYFAIQSLTSILLILIRSAEKNDPTIVHQILCLASQLCEQLPMKCLSSSHTNSLLFKSLSPLSKYVDELSASNDPAIIRQTMKVQLHLSIAKGSLKDILPLLRKLLASTTDTYDARSLLLQLKNGLADTLNTWQPQEESIASHSLEYLKSTESVESLTGPLLASILLAHIDIDHAANASQLCPISFEFHARTFQHLFAIIEQLSCTTTMEPSLVVCVRLFARHVEYLSLVTSTLDNDFLASKLLRDSLTKTNDPIDVSSCATNEQLEQWHQLFFTLACDENPQRKTVSEEAARALIGIITVRASSLAELFSSLHHYIVDNRHTALTRQCFVALANGNVVLIWIHVLCTDQKNEPSAALNVLYSLIDMYFQASNEINDQRRSQIESILSLFQQLLILRLLDYYGKQHIFNGEPQVSTNDGASSLLCQYVTRMLHRSDPNTLLANTLFQSVLLNLALLTQTEAIVHFEPVQSIFTVLLPLLTDIFLQAIAEQSNYHLLGMMTHALIDGPPLDPLEIKHSTKLHSSLFAGGYDEIHADHAFLMSIYDNVEQGAQLTAKLKVWLKGKQQPLQKSVEEQAHDACAKVFAVYLKHFRRVHLAQHELTRAESDKPHRHLLTIYDYAHRVSNVFATIKAQGGDCHDLHAQIKLRTRFLLDSVKESASIPIVSLDRPAPVAVVREKNEVKFQRQRSRWSKAKIVLTSLRHLMQACIRFKRIMLEKRQATSENLDYATSLHRSLETFIYGDIQQLTGEGRQGEIEELEQCLDRQKKRALVRLQAFRYFRVIVEKAIALEDKERGISVLLTCLPYLRGEESKWTYLENIHAANDAIKHELCETYYSLIQLASSVASQSPIFRQEILYLLNVEYDSMDFGHLEPFVSVVHPSDETLIVDSQYIAFQWFRSYVLQLCQHIERENLRGTPQERCQQQFEFAFSTLILKELKAMNEALVQSKPESTERAAYSLKDVAIGGFVRADDDDISLMADQRQIELWTDQYLVLLLRCIHAYEHVRIICASVDYLETLLAMYRGAQSTTTVFLTLRILRHILPSAVNGNDGKAARLIEPFLDDALLSIGRNDASQEMLTELIYLYRTLMSVHSPWQPAAVQRVLQSTDQLLASLYILGEYIEPYRLGSLVRIRAETEVMDDSQLAVMLSSGGSDVSKPYSIQYLQTNQIDSVSLDQLEHEVDIGPPDLLGLPGSKDPLDTVVVPLLDTLGHLIQTGMEATSESLASVQLRRCAVAVLSHLLTTKPVVEVFIKKPYAPLIVQLAMANDTRRSPPRDLRLFDKQHLKQYYLSLDRCESSPAVTPAETVTSEPVQSDPKSVVDALYVSKHYGWKEYMSKAEIDMFRQGRVGSDQISLSCMPRGIVDAAIYSECGTHQKFLGRIVPNGENSRASFPTFVVDNLELSEGSWYYCARLPKGGVIQIGWATHGFTPSGGSGVGDDTFSWSYDGSRDVLFHGDGFYGQFDGVRWTDNDVCGCGIEIDGDRTNIKYWLNGKLLGTAFTHGLVINNSLTECNLRSNGPSTVYYPSITIQRSYSSQTCCEWIFDPEDMAACPLPRGYKPLILPQVVATENSLVDYPCRAYLIEGHAKDYLIHQRANSGIAFLRDFVGEHHLETAWSIDDQRLVLSDKGFGFPLSINTENLSAVTISFDFQQLTQTNLDVPLCTFNFDETLSISTTLDASEGNKRTVIVVNLHEHHIQVYLNSDRPLCKVPFTKQSNQTFLIHLLPGIAAGISNIASWQYALSDEQLQRLLAYNLFYVGVDYQQMTEHRRNNNTISFSKDQREFSSGLLVPFNQPFDEQLWETKKQHTDEDERNYFRTPSNADHSVVELRGNKTYLVLDAPADAWSEYTLLLDLSIHQLPAANEHITLIALNSRVTIAILPNGNLQVKNHGDEDENASTVTVNVYFRLTVAVKHQFLRIYLNDDLQFEHRLGNSAFRINSKRIELFKEIDPQKNTTNDETVRVSLKSIAYLNRTLSKTHLSQPVEELIAPPLHIIVPSLIAMGYQLSWIRSVIEQNKTTHLPTLHRLLHEQKDLFIQSDRTREEERYLRLFSRLNPSIDQQAIRNSLPSFTFDTPEQLEKIAGHVLVDASRSPAPTTKPDDEESPSIENSWFVRTVRDLGIQQSLAEWLHDKTSVADDDIHTHQLVDLDHPEARSAFSRSSTKNVRPTLTYSHTNITDEQRMESRLACEHGLTTIYARSTIFTLLQIWCHDESSRFPIEALADYPSIVRLIKLFNDANGTTDDGVDRVSQIIHSILRTKTSQLLKHLADEQKIHGAPLLYHLQKDVSMALFRALLHPSLFESKDDADSNDWRFSLRVLGLIVEFLRDKSAMEQQQIDAITAILFPQTLVNLLFDLFLLVPTLHTKECLVRLFVT